MTSTSPTAQEIWKWTLTKEAIAPCFVRDVHAMRESVDKDADFFWLGYTPCRSVLLMGMVVAIQNYDKRAIYTIDDGTAVIDCILRHPTPPKSQDPSATSPNKKPQRSPPKKARLEKDGKAVSLDATEPPAPITEVGYPVRVVGKVVRHYESRQIHGDTIDPCPSSLDEINHLNRVIDLHKTRYSHAIPFVIPTSQSAANSTIHSTSLHPGSSTIQTDAGIFSSKPSCANPSTTNVTKSTPTNNYTLPAPRIPFRNRPVLIPTHNTSTSYVGGHVPSSPSTSSIASSTPSSPCKPSSPIKDPEFDGPPPKPKLRHPSRLHTRDLTANTFRLYLKHYMDNAPPPFPWSIADLEAVRTPTKRSRHAKNASDVEEETPRAPRQRTEDPNLGFTLSHLRRVPELALLASRVVRAETRRRDKAERDKAKGNGVELDAHKGSSGSSKSSLLRSGSGKSTSKSSTSTTGEPPRKKMKRLFSWAIVKLYEEGSIVMWDGDVRPLPVPPPPSASASAHGGGGGLWNMVGSASMSMATTCPSSVGEGSTSFLYASSASAGLYSHYHSPRRRSSAREDDIDGDADPAMLSDPGMDEEAYVPLTPGLLAPYVRRAMSALASGRGSAREHQRTSGRGGAGGRDPTAEEIVGWMRRMDGRWARVGVWAVEEALGVVRHGG